MHLIHETWVDLKWTHHAAFSDTHTPGSGKAKADPRCERLSAGVPTLTKLKYTRVDTPSEIRNISKLESGTVSKDTTYQRAPTKDQSVKRYTSCPTYSELTDVELGRRVGHFGTMSLQAPKNVNHGSF